MASLNRRAFLGTFGRGAAAAAFAGLAASACGRKSRDGKRLNVLFIVADDLRPALGCYGDPLAVTPCVDALAGRSMVFRRAFCQEGMCNPSRASLLTGLRPDTLHVWDQAAHFRDARPRVKTLPQHFKEHGYKTLCLGKVLHSRGRAAADPPSWSEAPRFQVLEDPAELYALEGNRTAARRGAGPVVERAEVSDEAYLDGRVCRSALEALERLREECTPFFLAVGFRKPHLPFCVPERYWKLHRRADLAAPHPPGPPAEVPGIALHDSPELRHYGDLPPDRPLPPEMTAKLRHGYYAAVSFTDALVGKLLRGLERNGLRENTIVVLLGDQGFHAGEQGLWGKITNFEICARVPLILAVPGRTDRNGVTDALVELVDLFPTLAGLCGLPMPPGMEGVNLLPLLEDPRRAWKRGAFTQCPRPVAAGLRGGVPGVMGYSLRTDRYRYTEWREWKSGAVRARELYDHLEDPLETRNLAGERDRAAEIKRLAALLRRGWKAVLPASR